MDWASLLREKEEILAARWLAALAEVFPPERAGLIQAGGDPFANPLGQAAARGTRELLPALYNGLDPARRRAALDDLARILAIQEIEPARALSFVFSLKGLAREELKEALTGGRFGPELEALDARVDSLALEAFAAFVRCREKIAELRVSEIRRQVSGRLARLRDPAQEVRD